MQAKENHIPTKSEEEFMADMEGDARDEEEEEPDLGQPKPDRDRVESG